MSSIKKETSGTSPVLFLNVKGEQMRFFLRPGPTKVQLQPLITNGGGVLCRTQEPTAILLADPGEISGVSEAASQFYISTQYIRDCVIQNQQLDIESYRFSNLQPVQTRMASRKQKGAGRMGYSMEDDSAILKFIARRQHDAKGNRVWKEMERQGITSHSWQSMKDRFLKHLQHKFPSKSPKKDTRSSPPTKGFSSDSDVPHSSSKASTPHKSKAAIIESSESDCTQISPETSSADQPDHESLPKQSSSTEPPDSETNHAHTVSNDAQRDPSGDQNQELEPEREQQEEDQQHEEDQLHEVAAKKARMENDSSGAGACHEHPTTSSPKERRKQKTSRASGRKLGILERAAREFEDSQNLDSQEDPSQPSSTTSETDDAQIKAAREAGLGAQAAMPEQHEPEAQNTCTPGPEDPNPGPSGVVAPITSNAHMFLFQQESQEDLSQPSEEDLSQDTSETMRHVVCLMQESKKDLVEVMKALLKASGDVTLAMTYLVEGRDPEIHGSLWTKDDDEVLLSADLLGREMLNEKYGAERVSKRMAFLTVE